jgi:signal transduction histidine kinase
MGKKQSAGGKRGVIERLAALPKLNSIPRNELEWLVAHGKEEVFKAGSVLAPKGKPIEWLYVVLYGHVAIRVDRGAGPRRVTEWKAGDVTGLLPYSRMMGPPGDNYLEEDTAVLSVHKTHFPEMIHRCPTFTAFTVHLMLDRARSFNVSDFQDDKMISLGKLAAGMAHEINNPASATVRGAKLLMEVLEDAHSAVRSLGEMALGKADLDALDRLHAACAARAQASASASIEHLEREDELADWLESHDGDSNYAATLAETAITVEDLDTIAKETTPEHFNAMLGWVLSEFALHSIAADIHVSATRIHKLVGAVKRFTYMDNLTSMGRVEVGPGLRETLRIVASKVKSKQAVVSLDVEAGLPAVRANGSELNQVWLNLVDNALDAINDGGHIEINAGLELDRVVVRVIDDGVGIPSEALPKIFDPFFTTKPPGHGIGLGLDISRRLIRTFEGDLSVKSVQGRTEFTVGLMVADDSNPK